MDNKFIPAEHLTGFIRQNQFYNIDGKKIALMPFSTGFADSLDKSLRNDFRTFDGCVGYCLREISDKSMPVDLEKDNLDGGFKAQLKSAILKKAVSLTIFDETEPAKLRAIIESMFFKDDSLLKYGSRAQYYLFWENKDIGLKKISYFIRNIFFDDALERLIVGHSDSKKHPFHELMNQSLPKLVDGPNKELTAGEKKNYHKLDAGIIETFREDFRYLYGDQKMFLAESALLFKFYYFSYLTKAVFRLGDFFEDKEHKLYFTLEGESVSRSRRTNELGWKLLESKIYKLFSHTVALELVNRIPKINLHNTGKSYTELAEFFSALDESSSTGIASDLEQLLDFYSDNFEKIDWIGFGEYYEKRKKTLVLKNNLESLVYKVFLKVDYQFEKSDRKSKRNNYGKWFISFCKENFLKNRGGNNGYTLNLSNEMLLFLTKLCVKDQQRMRLKDLWNEFNRRGIFFDDLTQQAILAIFEKINLIEKKSDSGDAQYIRPIL